MAEKFKAENKYIVCRELLGIKPVGANLIPKERTDEYYRKRPCEELVGCAARIMDEMINEKKKETAAS